MTAGLLIAGGGALIKGIFGGKKPKPLTAAQLEALFGPGVLAREAEQLYKNVLHSNSGQQMMASAAEQSQAFQTEMAHRAATVGLSPDTGGQSGASDFAVSSAAASRGSFERDVQAKMWKEAMAQAQQNLQMRAGLFSQQEGSRLQGQPNWADAIGTAAQGVGEGLAMAGPKKADGGGSTEPVGSRMGETGFVYPRVSAAGTRSMLEEDPSPYRNTLVRPARRGYFQPPPRESY